MDEGGNTIEGDGRHRIMAAVERGDKRISDSDHDEGRHRPDPERGPEACGGEVRRDEGIAEGDGRADGQVQEQVTGLLGDGAGGAAIVPK